MAVRQVAFHVFTQCRDGAGDWPLKGSKAGADSKNRCWMAEGRSRCVLGNNIAVRQVNFHVQEWRVAGWPMIGSMAGLEQKVATGWRNKADADARVGHKIAVRQVNSYEQAHQDKSAPADWPMTGLPAGAETEKDHKVARRHARS